MIAMAEDLALRKAQEQSAAKISTICLILSMLTMAVWGWTPLKNIVPAAPILLIFVGFVLVSICMAFVGVYRGIQKRALEARIEDES